LDAQATYWQLYVAGCWSGLLQTLALTPFESIKCQLQVTRGGAGGASGGHAMLACGRELVKHHGVARGLFRGWTAVALRDAPTFCIYFASYEATRRALMPMAAPVEPGGASAPASPSWVMLVGGAVAGASSWLLATPADVIKSVIQGSPINTPRAQLRIGLVARNIYAAEGAAGFFRGVVPSVVRSLPVNAVTFCGYEWALHVLRPAFGHDLMR
jgi:solute carrier family 25 carnitine/acylcarnitine transporter 20/29